MTFNDHRCLWHTRGVLFGLIVILFGTASTRADQSDTPGRAIFEHVCTACHGVAPIAATRNGPGGWRNTVYDMVDKGAQIQSQVELDSIVNYLSSTYGPSAGQMHTGPLPAGSAVRSPANPTSTDYLALLPSSKGADLVKGYCSICHDVGRIVATRRSSEEWHRYTVVMLARIGPPANRQIGDAIAAYLAANFGLPDQNSR